MSGSSGLNPVNGTAVEELQLQIVRLKRQRDKLVQDQQDVNQLLLATQQSLKLTQQQAVASQVSKRPLQALVRKKNVKCNKPSVGCKLLNCFLLLVDLLWLWEQPQLVQLIEDALLPAVLHMMRGNCWAANKAQ